MYDRVASKPAEALRADIEVLNIDTKKDKCALPQKRYMSVDHQIISRSTLNATQQLGKERQVTD